MMGYVHPWYSIHVLFYLLLQRGMIHHCEDAVGEKHAMCVMAILDRDNAVVDIPDNVSSTSQGSVMSVADVCPYGMCDQGGI